MDYRDKFKKIKSVYFITMCICSLLLGWCIGELVLTDYSKPKLIPKPSIYADTVKIEGFSENNLIEFMMLIEIQYPEIVLAQAKLESGNFTSQRFKKYNALFGFQTSDTNIIKYKSWKESVIHYKTWQMKRLKGGENYYDFLVRIKYAADSNYINKLKQF
jgi:flagellum-specific peptidoglycan hydrolase FlgJ